MRAQVTVVLTEGDKPGGIARVESTTLVLRPDDPYADPERVIGDAARQVARRLGLGKPTPEKEGGRG